MARRNLDELLALRAKLQRALSIRTASPQRRKALRRAYRKVSFELTDTQLDILARLQFLEGAFRSKKSKDKLLWTRGNLRKGLAMAEAAIREFLVKRGELGPDPKAESGQLNDMTTLTWLSTSSIGFYRDIKLRLTPVLKGRTSTPDDVMQMVLVGMNPSGKTFYFNEDNEPVPLDRLFQAAGFKSRRRKEQIGKGEVNPFDFSPILKKWAERKALNILKTEKREEERREKYWGDEVRAPSQDSWEDEVPEMTGVLPGEAVREDWGGQRSESWAFASALFHTDSPEAKNVRQWLTDVVFPKNNQNDTTMRHLFEMLEEGTFDVTGDRNLTRQTLINETLAQRVGDEIGKDMGPNANGQYTKLNAARKNGFDRIEKVMSNLQSRSLGDMREEEERLQTFLESLANRAQGISDPKAKADLSAAHRDQQATRKAVKELRAQIAQLQSQAGSSSGGASPKDVKNLEKAEGELRAARAEVRKKNSEYQTLRTESLGKAKAPAPMRKELATGKRELAKLEEMVEKADAAFLDMQAVIESSPKINKRMRDRMDKARKAKRSARRSYTIKRKAVEALTTEVSKAAVPPKKLQAALTKVTGELRALRATARDKASKVKELQARIDSAEGPSAEAISAKEEAEAALTAAKVVQRKARAAATRKRKELAALQKDAKSKAKPQITTEQRKALAAARKGLTAAKKAARDAKKAAATIQARFDGYKRPPKKVQVALAAARKEATRTKSLFTRRGNALRALLAETETAEAAPPKALQKALGAVETELKRLQAEAKKAATTVKRLTADLLDAEARLESGGSASGKGRAEGQEEAIANLQAQLASYEEKAVQNKERIHALENAAQSGPVTKEEKQQAVAVAKKLKVVRGKLSLLKMLDDLEIAGMGYGRLRKAHQKMALRVVRRGLRRRVGRLLLNER